MQYNPQTALLRAFQLFSKALSTCFHSQRMHFLFFLKSKLWVMSKNRFRNDRRARNIEQNSAAAASEHLDFQLFFLRHTSRQDHVTEQTTGVNIKIWNIESNTILKSLKKAARFNDFICMQAGGGLNQKSPQLVLCGL